jgi:hypothetical protein
MRSLPVDFTTRGKNGGEQRAHIQQHQHFAHLPRHGQRQQEREGKHDVAAKRARTGVRHSHAALPGEERLSADP